MKLINYCFLLVVILFPVLMEAQSSVELLDKYWQYRQRLVGTDGGTGFVDIGPNPGQSIPADGRNMISDCATDWSIQQKCPPQPGTGKMLWGDATAYQGFYIGMLALEYANLYREGRIYQMQETAQELYYALKVVERLDKTAETIFNQPASWDGFFVKDDVGVDFINDPTGSGGYRFSGSNDTQIACLSSDYACHRDEENSDNGQFMSQDQVCGLFFGYALVHELVPEVFVTDSTERFGLLVERQTLKIMDFLVASKWRIKGPDGAKISNKWGGDFRGFNNVFCKYVENIMGEEAADPYRTGSTRRIGWLARTTFDWAFGLQADRNHWMIFAGMVASGLWNNRKIAKRTRKSDRIMFALAYSAVHRTPVHSRINRGDIEALLASAPFSGPCFGVPGCEETPGWQANNRWVKPNHKNGNPYGLHYEWNGIDFLLFYNLYHYTYGQNLPFYGDLEITNR